ncbi:hypothetical protein BV25DRAFT_1839020 [Artomyces pyxidatus]|uniref:Uncharacterized protein n=1 Tax=Artomyces pyxidatus TaxID=48021 RepID=A0ACB8SZC8_9AGAM|nr:hypothetical protein BV25DRAFT_1839020 [Artomyces pyxidatus]
MANLNAGRANERWRPYEEPWAPTALHRSTTTLGQPNRRTQHIANLPPVREVSGASGDGDDAARHASGGDYVQEGAPWTGWEEDTEDQPNADSPVWESCAHEGGPGNALHRAKGPAEQPAAEIIGAYTGTPSPDSPSASSTSAFPASPSLTPQSTKWASAEWSGPLASMRSPSPPSPYSRTPSPPLPCPSPLPPVRGKRRCDEPTSPCDRPKAKRRLFLAPGAPSPPPVPAARGRRFGRMDLPPTWQTEPRRTLRASLPDRPQAIPPPQLHLPTHAPRAPHLPPLNAMPPTPATTFADFSVAALAADAGMPDDERLSIPCRALCANIRIERAQLLHDISVKARRLSELLSQEYAIRSADTVGPASGGN